MQSKTTLPSYWFNNVKLTEMSSECGFASATSQYKKTVGSANNYTYYVLKCIGELSFLNWCFLLLSGVAM